MCEEIISKRDSMLSRRQILEPGESTPWHVDPYHRFSVVVRGCELAIEYKATGEQDRFTVSPGEAGWDEPTDRVHRAINVGTETFEEVTMFMLDHPDAVPQPKIEE